MYRSSIQSQDNFEKSSESFELNLESLFHNVSFLVLAVADFKATAKKLYFHDSIWKQINRKYKTKNWISPDDQKGNT